jgi:hypothetical protein
MWTPGELLFEAQPFEGALWRMVETQYKAATMRLVDSAAEQAILENLIEEVKPLYPAGCGHLHPLLQAPFRYAPYPQGSRFRRAGQSEGAFYGSLHVRTALAETAFYRLLFLSESPAMKEPERPVDHTAFRVKIKTPHAIDLRQPPFAGSGDALESRDDYAACQKLADDARAINIDLILYASLRDKGGGNGAVLDPRAFAQAAPKMFENWKLMIRRDVVRAVREFPETCVMEFSRAQFADDPRF